MMGRLQKAIAKAREDQEGHSEQAADTARDARLPARFTRNSQKAGSHAGLSSLVSNPIVDFDDDSLREQRVIAASEYDERVEPYRQLRTLVLKSMRDQNWSTLAITSPHEGAGKSLTAANLAISLSRDVNTNVQLVDLDLRTPTVHEKLHLQPEKGLIDYLEESASLEEILYDPGLKRLVVLVGRPAGKFSSELLASPRMDNLMQDFCQLTDPSTITIFDLPPLLRNDDALLITPKVDATLIVVEDGVTTDAQFKQAMRLLRDANIIGTILNKATH